MLTFIRRPLLLFSLLLPALLLSACDTAIATPDAALTADADAEQVIEDTASTDAPDGSYELLALQGDDEFLRLAGSGVVHSEPISITEEQTVQVNWQQTSSGVFTLVLRNAADEIGEDDITQVNIEAADGPSNGQTGVTLPAGEYTVDVLSANGDWTIWLASASALFENAASEEQLLHISGGGPGTSEVFHVEAETDVSIAWTHTSLDNINVVLVYTPSDAGERVEISLPQLGAAESASFPFTLASGDYYVHVQSIASDFEITIAPLP